jgi:VanZ family protein
MTYYQKMKYKILLISWLILIFISSSIPSSEFPEVSFWGWATLIHLIYFGVLCFLLQTVLLAQRNYPFLARHALLFAILLATVYGMTDEFHQLFTPGRHAQVTDVLVDALGACLYVAGALTYRFFRQRQTNAARP